MGTLYQRRGKRSEAMKALRAIYSYVLMTGMIFPGCSSEVNTVAGRENSGQEASPLWEGTVGQAYQYFPSRNGCANQCAAGKWIEDVRAHDVRNDIRRDNYDDSKVVAMILPPNPLRSAQGWTTQAMAAVTKWVAPRSEDAFAARVVLTEALKRRAQLQTLQSSEGEALWQCDGVVTLRAGRCVDEKSKRTVDAFSYIDGQGQEHATPFCVWTHDGDVQQQALQEIESGKETLAQMPSIADFATMTEEGQFETLKGHLLTLAASGDGAPEGSTHLAEEMARPYVDAGDQCMAAHIMTQAGAIEVSTDLSAGVDAIEESQSDAMKKMCDAADSEKLSSLAEEVIGIAEGMGISSQLAEGLLISECAPEAGEAADETGVGGAFEECAYDHADGSPLTPAEVTQRFSGLKDSAEACERACGENTFDTVEDTGSNTFTGICRHPETNRQCGEICTYQGDLLGAIRRDRSVGEPLFVNYPNQAEPALRHAQAFFACAEVSAVEADQFCAAEYETEAQCRSRNAFGSTLSHNGGACCNHAARDATGAVSGACTGCVLQSMCGSGSVL